MLHHVSHLRAGARGVFRRCSVGFADRLGFGAMSTDADHNEEASSGPQRTVHVHGATGRLGSMICALPNAEPLLHRSTAPLPSDDIEIVVDTSLPAGLKSLLSRLQDGAEAGASALVRVFARMQPD